VSTVVLEPPIAKMGKWVRKKTHSLEGHVEKVQIDSRFLQLRFGKEPGEYLILHVPKGCRIHRGGEPLPLKDVQFCDNVTVRYHQHYRFDVQLAQEIEIC
jgi:hypothetical protein